MGSSHGAWEPAAFYERQEELSGAYSGEVADHHRAKASLLEAHCGRLRRVLELGAGGGQMAVATAELGFSVEAVELVPRLAAHARMLASRTPQIRVIEGDFYEVAVEGPFGAVCYWDGFGIGSDSDQQVLLSRVGEWLADDGRALIDVYTPWYWAAAAGQEMVFDRARRRYGFDEGTQTMIDLWWPDGARETVAQRLRCYAPQDLARLLEEVGLALETIAPGDVALEDAMSYTAIVRGA